MAKKIIQIIICIVLAVIVAIFVVGISMQAIAKFELSMLHKLIFPIILVAIPAYILIYSYLFKKRRKRR
jgi:membrane protease YdiL (CAAX protease family)